MKNASPRPRWLIVAAALSLCLPVPAMAAERSADEAASDRAKRPRVGLVLGGGGARGAAHVGVLQELERMRIPVDAIVGTSMGAIIGGLYASGMSALELEELVSTLDWAQALNDRPDRSDFPYRRKQDDAAFPIGLELGLTDGHLQLPQGVVHGHNLDLLLHELILDVHAIDDFDDLGIPFRAIASDLVSGEAHVIGEGDLALAMRASMSVPGVFAPVEANGRLLADGGLTGNLGIDVMQEMDVDIIIAVDVEFPLYPLGQLTSALAISEQVLTILIRNETRRQIALLSADDILLRPKLGHFGSTNFSDSILAFEPGVAAVRANADRLRSLSVDEARYAGYQMARAREILPETRVEFVRVVDRDGRPLERLARRMSLKPGDSIDAGRLAAEANRLHGLRTFEKVGYTLIEDNAKTGVEFKASAKTWGRDFLRFGLGIEDDFEGSTAFNFSTRVQRFDVNRLGAEWQTDLRLGTSPVFASEFFQPLGLDSRFFIAPSIELSQRNTNTFIADERVARFRISEASVGFDIGASLGNIGELRIGAIRGDGNARVKVGDPGIPNRSYGIGVASARLAFDSLDDAHFPHSGLRGELRWDLSRSGLGADDSYEVLSLDVNKAWSFGKNTLIAGANFITSRDADDVIQAQFPLGGFLRLSGFERGQISGPHAGVARLVYYRRIGRTGGGIVEVPIYAGASIEGGNAWRTRDDIGLDNLIANGSLFVGLDTYFGPMFLAAGFSEDGGSNLYLFIGALPD